MTKQQKPGEKPNQSGEYEERGPREGKLPNPTIVTIEPGDEKMPPTKKSGRTWVRIGKPKP